MVTGKYAQRKKYPTEKQSRKAGINAPGINAHELGKRPNIQRVDLK